MQNFLGPHFVKSVQIRSFFWSVFSHIPTEYGDIPGHFSRSDCFFDEIKHITGIPRWNDVEMTVSMSFQRGVQVMCLHGYCN